MYLCVYITGGILHMYTPSVGGHGYATHRIVWLEQKYDCIHTRTNTNAVKILGPTRPGG
jgi:hypothetical protein